MPGITARDVSTYKRHVHVSGFVLSSELHEIHHRFMTISGRAGWLCVAFVHLASLYARRRRRLKHVQHRDRTTQPEPVVKAATCVSWLRQRLLLLRLVWSWRVSSCRPATLRVSVCGPVVGSRGAGVYVVILSV